MYCTSRRRIKLISALSCIKTFIIRGKVWMVISINWTRAPAGGEFCQHRSRSAVTADPRSRWRGSSLISIVISGKTWLSPLKLLQATISYKYITISGKKHCHSSHKLQSRTVIVRNQTSSTVNYVDIYRCKHWLANLMYALIS